MKTYDKYKSSGVDWIGDIPENWKLKKLKYLVESVDKTTSETSFLIAVENIESKTGKLVNLDADKTYQGVINEFQKGDVLFNKLRPYLAKVYYAEQDGGYVGELLNFRAGKELHNKFLYYRVFSGNFIDIVDSSTTGTKMPRASWEDFISHLLIAFPSDYDEQTAIADYLDEKTAQIDSLINNKLRLIELLKEERTAIINQAVTRGINRNAKLKPSGIAWLGDIPEHWNLTKLKFFVDYAKGYAFKTDFFQPSGIPVIKASDIKNLTIRAGKDFLNSEVVEQFEKVKLSVGDVVISTVGSTPDVINSAVGQIAKVPVEFDGSYLNQNTLRIYSNDEENFSNNFLFFFLISNPYRKYLDLHAHGTANQASLNVEDMLNFVVALPSSEEQKQIVEFIETATEKIDATIAKIEKEIGFMREYRTALISEVVTGKIKVI